MDEQGKIRVLEEAVGLLSSNRHPHPCWASALAQIETDASGDTGIIHPCHQNAARTVAR